MKQEREGKQHFRYLEFNLERFVTDISAFFTRNGSLGKVCRGDRRKNVVHQ